MAQLVQHGRRRGTPKQGLKEEVEMPRHFPNPDMDMEQLKQVTILTKGDWERISNQLQRRQINQERARKAKEEREKIKQRSKEMIKDWPNTIAGQRKAKLEARKIREAKNEEERLQMDIEEAKYQAAQRKEVLDEAKTKQYYQTDRVKGFHSALQLTEVLKERDAQVELTRLKSLANQGKDQEWADKARREYEEGIMDDQRAAAARIMAAKATQGFQRNQVKDHLKARLIEREEDRHEGEEIQKLAIQHQLEKKRLEDIRKEEQAEMAANNRRQIADQRKMKEIEELQQEQEDEESRIFAAAKRKMMKLRAEKEKELHDEKQERLERIREKLAAQMKQKMDDEDDRIKRAIAEQDARMAAEDEQKARENAQMMREISAHRSAQMRKTEDAAAEGRRRDAELIKARLAADEVFKKNEQEKYLRRRHEASQLAAMHLDQARHVRDASRRGRQDELDHHARTMQQLDVEEQQFQEYAGKVIRHCEDHGRNVFPLRKAAKAGAGGGLGPQFPGKGGIRPSYMAQSSKDQGGVQLPHYDSEGARDVKHTINGNGDTQKRMGFVW